MITSAPVRVRLTSGEMMQAALVGVMRHVGNLKRGRQDAHGYAGDGWAAHIEGACGELALAKALGLYWSGALEFRADDVGRLQVRTRSRHDYDLIVHPEDPDDRPFVLVTGKAPDFRVGGWIMGRDAKRQAWWADPAGGRPAFFVRAEHLRPIEELARSSLVATDDFSEREIRA